MITSLHCKNLFMARISCLETVIHYEVTENTIKITETVEKVLSLTHLVDA